MSLYGKKGHRKYLTPAEREAFLNAAGDAPREVRTLCHVLAYSACRISKALALTADRVDLKDGTLIFESLEKRCSGVFRPVPVPPALIDALNMVHDIRAAQKRRDRGRDVIYGQSPEHRMAASGGSDGSGEDQRTVTQRRRGCGTDLASRPSRPGFP